MAEELAAAAAALLDGTTSRLGARFVASVHLPWLTGRPHTPAPGTSVLAGVLRRLGENPSLELLDAYVAADARRCAALGSVDPSPQEQERFISSVPAPEAVPAWLVGFDCPAHDAAREELDRLSGRLAAAGGGRLDVEAALSSTRWWPGRREWVGEVTQGPLGLHGLFRSLEERRDLGDWRGPWTAASDLAVKGLGLPSFDPEDWVLAAFRRAPVDRGGLGLG
ncbi:hypothetical protein KRR39_06765 [Nocardioides panacis]|uniref:Uncharacterized protein n=1 Tax=Nocardioides panacis TaxID=2849501 RepID=A0A975T0P0_9ACTN|nr:hypothetical protein [Nocardioides panacis]QWZ09460.1 hypothetical protein KRR39_06765 [Nocardioides panacis]